MSRAWFGEALDEIDSHGLRREMDTFDGPASDTTQLGERDVLRLASNNYLGLSTHPYVNRAAQAALERYGTTAGASPLVSGHTRALEKLETAIAELKGTEEAVVFPSGYQANTGTIPALVNEGDLVLSDSLNHASIVDACRLSKARVEVYHHANPSHLADLLDVHRDGHRRCLIVTDGVFSMDARVAPLPEIAEVAEAHDAMLMVDDAHGTGVLGETGAGTVEHHGLDPQRVDVHVGTLSKALASQGGFVAGSSELCDLLRNTARSYVFSTALSPSSAVVAWAAIDVLGDEPIRREQLHANADRLREGLHDAGFKTLGSKTPIVPVVVGDRYTAQELAQALRERNVFCPAIRPPSVPEGTSRLRATVIATHTREQIHKAVRAFEEAGQAVGVIG